MLLAVVRQLVNEAHVQQKDILVYDARKYIPPYMLAKVWKEFSGVRFLQERPLAKSSRNPRLPAITPGSRRPTGSKASSTPTANTRTPS